ncbi:beta-lactamase-like protein [Elsinoe ampelina]|uniref:Cleavage and polyadenylation specificity factor subunit 2 n=1 Tax=Elsinoe ampelina TaxID=302913 RepID=A0A6A6GQZ9_9PEZI|nr:beta-lactamase-like protein [Elsinoe ampelina]
MFTFTPLLGAQAESRASQSLLELDGGIKVLIDVGWDESFSTDALRALEEQIPSLSVILLTHPTLDHLGAFAHLCKHVPQFKSIPVYATSPVISLGRTLLQDLYASSPLASTIVPESALVEATYLSNGATNGAPSILLQPPTTEDIAGYFSLINPLKYSQPTQPIASPFSPSLNGLTITAYGAGHTLGGTIWHIQHGLESIVYAVDWNQAKENILSGAAWLSGGGGGADILEPLRRPTALVCSSKGIERPHAAGGRKRRDERLLEAIDKTIGAGGTVLIPSDSSARVLELAYIMEQFWRKKVGGNDDTYRNAKIHLASRTAGSTLRFARSMVEWMDDSLVRDMEAANDSRRGQRSGDDRADQTPFDFKHVKLVERAARLEKVLSTGRPGVILASDTSLDWGFSKSSLQRLCANPKNLVIMTSEPTASESHQTLSSSLWKIYRASAGNASSASTRIIPSNTSISTRQPTTQPLNESELPIYQQYLARRRQVQSTSQGQSSTVLNAEAAEDDGASSASSSSSEDEDDDKQGRALNVTAALQQNKRKVNLTDADLGVNILIRKKNVYDYDVRGKRGREKMFPFAAKRGREDDYGEAIRTEEYRRAEEIDQEAEESKVQEGAKREVGEKRKWDDAGKEVKKGAKKGRTERAGLTSSTRGMNGETAKDEEMGEGSDSEEEEGPDEAEVSGPRKVVFQDVTLDMKISITHVDFSALHEKRDLQMLIPLIKPRKLIITSGTKHEVMSLADDCRMLLGEEDDSGKGQIVFTPKIGETVDVSVDTNAWSVKLTRDLVKKLTWQSVKGLGVVAVTARLAVRSKEDAAKHDDAEEQKRKKLKLGEADADEPNDEKVEREPVLDILPATASFGSAKVTQPIHVGDLRLADLRRLMQAGGHVAEFRGEGTLLIDGTVIVRKTAGGRIDVEGGAYMGAGRYDPTLSFQDVRRRIYEGLAVVAGG